MNFFSDSQDRGILPMGDGTYVNTQTEKIYDYRGHLLKQSKERGEAHPLGESERDERTSIPETIYCVAMATPSLIYDAAKRAIKAPQKYLSKKISRTIGELGGLESEDLD